MTGVQTCALPISKDYQEYLEKYILRVNYKSFINVVILGSARYNPFMQMSASDRRAIIEELLGIQIFSTMNVLIKDKISKVKEQILNEEYNIDLTKEKINLQNNNIEEQKKNTEEDIKNKKNEIKKSKNEILNYQKQIKLISKHIELFQQQIKDKTSVENKKNKLFIIEHKLQSAIEKLNKEIDFYQNSDNCPTCRQTIIEEFKKTQLESNNIKQKELADGVEKLKQEFEKNQIRTNEIAEINKKIQEHNSEIVRINASIMAIQNYIQKEIENVNSISKKYDNIEFDNEKLKELNDSLINFNLNKESLVSNKKYYDFASVLLKDGGIKTRIIKQYLPILNKLINTYFNLFFGK